jgi:hypothetical protein
MAARSVGIACIFSLLFPISEAAWLCEDVETYYASTKDLQGKQLEMELTRIIKQEYKLIGYSSSWSAINSLDATEKGSGMVRLIYSDDIAPEQAGCPENKCVWNREHLWPQVHMPCMPYMLLSTISQPTYIPIKTPRKIKTPQNQIFAARFR